MIATEVRKPYKKDGIWNYPSLPEGMRVAKPADFNVLSDEVVFGINILYKPAGSTDYQARNIRDKANLAQWHSDIIAGNVYIEKLPYKQGLWYYPRYPLSCRTAQFSDFLTADNTIIAGVDFVVMSNVTTDYEAHRTSTIERFIPWLDWVQAGRVFVKIK